MRMVRFRAASVAAAMAEVRREFGPDALILSTRRVGGVVEVAAAIESDPSPPPGLALAPAPALPPPPLAPPPPSVRPALPARDDLLATTLAQARGMAGSGLQGGAADVSDRDQLLRWHGVPDLLAARLRAGPLAFALSLALRFATLPGLPGISASPGHKMLLLGPPGSGKTLTLVRLATRFVLAGIRPVVASTDTQRAGAHEQLAALTRVLGLAPVEASDPVALARALAAVPRGVPVLIDSAGLDPFDEAAGAQARALAAASGAEPVGVLAAGGDPDETADIAACLAGLGARCLVATRLDLARRLGGVLAASAHLALAEFGTAPDIAQGLVAATPAGLARRLMAPNSGAVLPPRPAVPASSTKDRR